MKTSLRPLLRRTAQLVNLLSRFPTEAAANINAGYAAHAPMCLASYAGHTPLLIACDWGHTDCARLCLEAGVEVNLAGQDGATPLMMACEEGHEAFQEGFGFARQQTTTTRHALTRKAADRARALILEATGATRAPGTTLRTFA